ncbi:2-phospho-L-lactate transferase [Georgenia halophila]|uniref:2-phospho-L-lactate transferase n=1 Tax=Georgenia halophila TaxID=620889 RepID=A0ABP8KT16_9MICO
MAGGVGGAKLAEGLTGALDAPEDLTVVVNTGDDAVVHGLCVSPDLDTVMYTLAGMSNTDTGWGVADDTFTTLEAMARLGADTWFQLGDRDLATNIVRSARLRDGVPLSQVTADLCRALGIGARLLPMTDQRVATILETPSGPLEFQEYFVARRHQDPVLGVTFEGVEHAHPAPGVLEALEADVVVVAPSNPFVSLGPILAVPGVRDALAATSARRVAVSPIVGGRALKGPAAAMLQSMGHETSALGVARLWSGLVDELVIDDSDAALAPAIEELGISAVVTGTVMGGRADRERLAHQLLVR